MSHSNPRFDPPSAAVMAAPPRQRLVLVANAVVAAFHLSILGLVDAAGTSQVLVALGLYGLSAGLLVWARRTVRRHPAAVAVSPLAPARLVVHGPFCLVRQPFFAAYVGIWMAGALATGHPWLMLSAAWMTVFYVLLAQHEESRFDRTMFAEAYHAYRRNTGMLFPRVQVELGESARPLRWGASEMH